MLFVFYEFPANDSMHRSPKYRRKAWRRTRPTAEGFRLPWSASLRSSDDSSARLTRKESISFALLAVGACIGAILFLHFTGGWHAQRHRDQMLESLRNQYSLTEIQVAAIREIEDRYHGTGSIYFRPTHGPREEAAHQLAISQQMSPESAAIFLATRNSKSASISHQH